jgi:hypothetical protein
MAPELFGGVAVAIAGGIGHCGVNWTSDCRQKTIKRSDLAGGNVYAGLRKVYLSGTFPFLSSVGGHRMQSDGGDSSVASNGTSANAPHFLPSGSSSMFGGLLHRDHRLRTSALNLHFNTRFCLLLRLDYRSSN